MFVTKYLALALAVSASLPAGTGLPVRQTTASPAGNAATEQTAAFLDENDENAYRIFGGDSLMAQNAVFKHSPDRPAAVKVYKTTITGYSSTPEETDDTPFITASGALTRPGVVAANFLPFGTKIRIPALFGDRIFTVEDRMHVRNGDKIDIWFSSKEEALNFGRRFAVIEVLK